MRVHLTCPMCAVAFQRYPSTITTDHTFCSKACAYAYRHRPSPVELLKDGVTARVTLRADDGSPRAYALIDAADAAWAAQWAWCLDSSGYAVRRVKKQRYAMHRDLLGLKRGDGLEGDHINRDRLDNRRGNLREATHAQNSQNLGSFAGGSSVHRGVTWDKETRKWLVQIRANGKTVKVGRFKNEDEAAEAARLARARYMPYAVD